MLDLSYVLITAARNEELFLEKTIASVTAQTILPLQWVIVDDGSTDRTSEIIEKHARQITWIVPLRMPIHEDRCFGAKARCFNAAYQMMTNLRFDVVGNLDADLSCGSDHFEYLLTQFAKDSDLGVAGTPFLEHGRGYDYRFTNIEHVSGACQLFRRECFEEIGGYTPIRGGGIDWVAVTTARMLGWRTRTFVERACVHHRPMGTGVGTPLGACFRHGMKDYFLGGHPLWQVFRCVFQMKRRPYVVGGLLLALGYAWAWAQGKGRSVSPALVRFHQDEQMARLRRIFGLESGTVLQTK